MTAVGVCWRRCSRPSSVFLRYSACSLSSQVSSIAHKATSKKGYLKFDPEYDEINTELLRSMTKCSPKQLEGSTVQVLSLDFPGEKIGIKNLGGSELFVRDFYPRLLEEIRKKERAVLIGNPGIGKSFFQYYYLARLVNPDKLGPLPPDHRGSTDPPKIVIRQMGQTEIIIYDIEEMVAERISMNPRVFRCFDQYTSLYLMEPEGSKVEPTFGGLWLPTLLTASPLLDRYKEFCKNGGRKFYMPVFEMKELQAIGKYLLDHKNVIPDDMKEMYTPGRIQERFDEFGGIFRIVLPIDVECVADMRKERKLALSQCVASDILNSEGNIEEAHISHLLMQYDVDRDGNDAFRLFRMKFANSDVRNQLEEKLANMSLENMQKCLMLNDETGHFDGDLPKVHEKVIHLLLSKGVKWKRTIRAFDWSGERDPEKAYGDIQQWEDFECQVGGVVGFLPLEDMKCDQLCYPCNSNFPFVDFYLKRASGDNEQELVLFQVTRQKQKNKIFKRSAMVKFFEKIAAVASLKKVKLRMVLIPHPKYSKKSLFVPDKTDISDVDAEVMETLKSELKEYEVWNIPENYRETFE